MKTNSSGKQRKIVGGLLGALVLLAVLPNPANAYPRPGITERVSVASGGAQANSSVTPLTAISADGRYVAFDSNASNLVPGDTNGSGDMFVHDRATGATERISVASDGAQANGDSSYTPAISADGRYVAFSSRASNLVPVDTNGAFDVFVHDRATGATQRASVAPGGTQANSYSNYPAISADGRYVGFWSNASNLVPGDTNAARDVFVHDLATGTTERVSVASDGAEANPKADSVFSPAISGDGRYVAFYTTASNLVSGDTNAAPDVFVHDRDTGTTERVSVTSNGTEGNSSSYASAISADGRYVAFFSGAFNLVPGDTNAAPDVFVHDRAKGTTERVSVASNGTEANSSSYTANAASAISGDGRYVAFYSLASNLVSGDTNWTYDVFVHDRATGTTERVSVASNGTEANGYLPAISGDGRYVAFYSEASNLAPGDTNGAYDAFVHDRGVSLGVVGTPSVLKVPGGVGVSGRATFSGATLAEASDPDDDGTSVGTVGAADAGAELTGAALIYRPEQEDLLVSLRVSSLPFFTPQVCIENLIGRPAGVGLPIGYCQGTSSGAGLPAILYGLGFAHGGVDYEVRALRTGATSGAPRMPHMALYRCAPDCSEHASLTGSLGTTGEQVLVSVPLSALGAPEGTELTDLRAFTAVGEATPGAIQTLDEVPFSSSSVIPASRVELGIAPVSTLEDEVAFTVNADLVAGEFSGTIPSAGLSPGSYRTWVRACLGDACGSAVAALVTLGDGPVELINTNLELIIGGQGQKMTLEARLTELDFPNKSVVARTINFYSDGELIGSDVTDGHGTASVPVPPAHRGSNRTYEAVFEGDDLYLQSSAKSRGKGTSAT